MVVGSDEESRNFWLPEGLAKSHSAFLAAALHKGWKEAEEHIVRLPTDTVETFRVFHRFVYTGKIFSEDEILPDLERDDTEWELLARCWVLGEKLQAGDFKDAIADAVVEKHMAERRAPLIIHRIVYAGSASANPFRSLMVDLAVCGWSQSDMCISKLGEEVLDAFYFDVAVALKGGLKDMPSFEGKKTCKYHEHVAAGTACYKIKFAY